MSKIFKQAPVQIQNSNGFDKGFTNSFSGKVGTLYPIVCNQVMPGTKISYGISAEVQLPPMATDFYGTIEYCIESFFVPCRILYGGFKEFITHDDTTTPPFVPGSYASLKTSMQLPFFKVPKEKCGLGTLQDFLGLKQKSYWPELASYYYIPNPLKHLAYAKIYDDWYRDSRIQLPLFVPANTSNNTSVLSQASRLPFLNTIEGSNEFTTELADYSHLYDLRQRNFSKDYFTNATLQPQAGNDVALTFSSEGSDDGNGLVSSVGSFTIRGLRAANTLQLWRERNNIAGNRYADQMKARFGVYPSDAITDRPIYLGSKRFTVYNKSVYQSLTSQGDTPVTKNPFTSVGSKYSSPLGVLPREQGNIVKDFFTTEYGYFVVIGSLVPKVIYSSGTDRHLWDNTLADFADPILSQVGDQPIYKQELFDDLGGISPEFGLSFDTFGYTQRYSHWKYIDDQVHGLLSDDGNLSAFALQRSFDSKPDLSSEFITIPTDYLDGVTAVSGTMSQYGYWCDTYNDLRITQPLPAYSIPTLGNPGDTHTEFVHLGGTRL